MASIAVETTVDADVVEIVVAPRGCAVFFFFFEKRFQGKQPSSA
jgi:hypothetical protein